MDTSDLTHEEAYKNIGRVYCPYFRDHVEFTRIGFEHLKLKTKYKARTEKDRNMRFRLLPIALKIIGQSHTLQGKTYRRRFEDRYINNRKESALLDVTYYEFLAIIDGVRAKVIVKQIEDRNKIFLSIIPFFKQKIPLEESGIL